MLLNGKNLDALYEGFNLAFQDAFKTVETMWPKVAMQVQSNTTTTIYPYLGHLPNLREWVGDRHLRELALYDYAIKNVSFELTVAVRAADIEDDQVGVYKKQFEFLGDSAARHPDQLVFNALKNGHDSKSKCYDGKPFFDKAHPVGKSSVANNIVPASDPGEAWFLLCTTRPVKPIIYQVRKPYILRRMDNPTDENVFMRDEYIYGVDGRCNVGYGFWQMAVRSTEALDAAGYAKARTQMMAFKDEHGVPLGLIPNLLVVPPTLESAARQVVVSAIGPNGATNEWAGSAELLINPYLA